MPVLPQVLAELLQAGLQHLGIAEGAVAHADGLGHIEVVAGDHQDLLGGHGVLGQGLGVHVVIIVDQAGGAHGLGAQVQVGLGGDPVLHDLAVGLQNGTGAGPQGLVVLQRDGGDDLVPDAAADGVVGTAGLHDLVHLVVAADDPADTGAGHGVHLGHTADGDGLVVAVVQNGGHIVLVQPAIDLVAEDPGVVLGGDVHDLAQTLVIQGHADGVVGVGQDDHLGVVVAGLVQGVEIQLIVLLGLQLDHAGLDAAALGDIVVLLIGGLDHHAVVARLQHAHQHQVIGAGAAVGDHDFLGLHVALGVNAGHRRLDPGGTGGVAVVIMQAHGTHFVQESVQVLAGQVKQLVHTKGADAAAAQIDTGQRIHGIQPFLHTKPCQFHFVVLLISSVL